MSEGNLEITATGLSSTGRGTGGEPPVLRCVGIAKRFGETYALKGIDVTVERGEIRGLAGGNGSGKSTFIKILAGFHTPDQGGRLELNGTPVRFPVQEHVLREMGVSFVHQDLGLIPSLSVVDNFLLGTAQPISRWHIPWRNERGRLRPLLERYGIDVPLSARVDALRPVDRARLAIVRAADRLAATQRPSLLVLDEPTTLLPSENVAEVTGLMRTLASDGCGIIFVTHHIDELVDVCRSVTVLRDGEVVGMLRDASEVTRQRIVALMLGDEAEELDKGRRTEDRSAPATDALPCLQIRGAEGREVRAIDLDVQPGEVVGLTGLVGSGYEELLRLVVGDKRARAGTVAWNGGGPIPLSKMTPIRALDHGGVFVPSDRVGEGAVADLTVMDNVCLPTVNQSWSRWYLNRGKMRSVAGEVLERFDVKPADPRLPMGALSGGNQQKAILGKWMQTGPKIVFLAEPSQGVDVGARERIGAEVRAAVRSGMAFVVASSDYEFLELCCDRVLVVDDGRAGSELHGAEITAERINREVLQGTAVASGQG